MKSNLNIASDGTDRQILIPQSNLQNNGKRAKRIQSVTRPWHCKGSSSGCLSVFSMMIGTEIWPAVEEWKGKLLFLETAEDYPTPDDVKYFLRNLVAQGIVYELNGIIVGKPFNEQFYEEYKEVYIKVIGEEAGRRELPIIYNVNCGHTSPVCILPNGIKAEIDCDNRRIALVEKPVLIG